MGNTVFYDEAKKKNPNISWKDILSESFKKHSMKDLEYALAAGSVYDTASPETMLKKWHKPWVWTRIFLLLSVIGFGFYGVCEFVGLSSATMWSSLIILTCVTPITSMVLFWELNVARDVSFVKLLICFFIGGLLSLTFTLILNDAGIRDTAIELTNTNTEGVWQSWVAPLTEEPAKLLAGLVILMILSKSGDNIFGCSGIAIGAGVGTGFTLFESFGYVMDSTVSSILDDNVLGYINELYQQGMNPFKYAEISKTMFQGGLDNILGRSIPGINGHMLMCVPYIAMIAFVYHETKDWKKSVFNKKTGITFICSCILHGWWDCVYGVSFLILNINENTTFSSQAELDAAVKALNNACKVQYWLITVLYLVCNLFVIRLCLQQAVREGNYVSGQSMALGERTAPHYNGNNNWQQGNNAGQGVQPTARALLLISTGSVMSGASWQCKDTFMIGKMNDCAVKFPADTAGLSREHCRLRNCGSYWTICDVGSSYGTYVNRVRLNPNTEYKILPGSVLELGSSKVQLKIQ